MYVCCYGLLFYSDDYLCILICCLCVFCMQSKAGPILIALNPFKDVQIYGNDYVSAYRKKSLDSPHVFAMVDAAYNEMIGGK